MSLEIQDFTTLLGKNNFSAAEIDQMIFQAAYPQRDLEMLRFLLERSFYVPDISQRLFHLAFQDQAVDVLQSIASSAIPLRYAMQFFAFCLAQPRNDFAEQCVGLLLTQVQIPVAHLEELYELREQETLPGLPKSLIRFQELIPNGVLMLDGDVPFLGREKKPRGRRRWKK